MLANVMASGWRKLLEEESEHQWLAIGLFFVFIIIGGFLIGGTNSLEGMVLGTDPSHDLVFEEGDYLIDIEYHRDALGVKLIVEFSKRIKGTRCISK